MILKKIFAFSISIIVLTSCSSNGNDTKVGEFVSSYINGNSDVITFGSVGVNQLLSKTDYKSEEKLNALISTEYNKLEAVINLSDKTYFVVEGPLANDGTPKALLLFFNVKNLDSLTIELESRSFDLNKVDDITYTEGGDFMLAFNQELAVAYVSSNDYQAEVMAKDLFKAVGGDVSGGKVDEILAEKGDLVFGVSLENLYRSSNTDLQKLDEATQKNIEDMAENSFVKTSFKFEDGAIIVESENMFNDFLRDQLFFKTDETGAIFKKLNKGDGFMLAAASINFDINKMEEFYTKYSPETIDALTQSMGVDSGMLALLGSEDLMSKLSDGQLGISVVANTMDNSFGVNSFLGATDTGKTAFQWLNGNIPYELNYDYKEDGIYGASPDLNLSNSVALPKGCEVFGQKGITAFINFSDVDLEEFNFSGEMKFLEIVDYITFEYGTDGGKLLIKAKNGQENVLKQVMEVFMYELSNEINGMSI